MAITIVAKIPTVRNTKSQNNIGQRHSSQNTKSQEY